MKKIKDLIFASVCLLGMTVAVSSCDEKGPDEPDVPAVTGSTIMVPNEANAVVEVTLDMESDWNVSNSNTWFTVQPLSGVAGQATFTITVLDTNPELSEKVATFRINENGTPTEYYVIQDVTPGMYMPNNNIALSDASQEAAFTFSSNVDVTVTSGADWLTVGEIKKDSVLLADNATYSKFKTYTVNISASENSGEVREAEVQISAVDVEMTETFTVSQMGELVADFSKDFYRRSMAFRLTATSCGYCPIMAEAMKQTYEETDGRFIPFTIYCPMNAGDNYVYENWRYWFSDVFDADGWPTGITNGYANLGNYNTNKQVSIYKELVEEARVSLPSKTVIGGTSKINVGTIEVELSVASKEAGDYILGVFLMENGIVGYQNGGGGDYEHNFVLRKEFSAYSGDAVQLSANSTKEFTYSMPVPEDVEDINNCYVCVWVAYEGTFTGEVSEPNGDKLYFDYGIVIDNVVNIPLNGFAIFEYEN